MYDSTALLGIGTTILVITQAPTVSGSPTSYRTLKGCGSWLQCRTTSQAGRGLSSQLSLSMFQFYVVLKRLGG